MLTAFGQWLNEVSNGNHYLVTGVIGVVSSIVDNVPLVAGCMDMYAIAPTGDFACDGLFRQLLAYCAGVGGSMLIIGSAAGVVVMGLEKSASAGICAVSLDCLRRLYRRYRSICPRNTFHVIFSGIFS